jgi:NTP pyrophosphatase (non-canonical NTP hydrolase)
MRSDLLEYVRALSLADKKSLTAKVAKLFEEGGELAKAALPYENAHATTHRFVTSQQILEESVDTILVALSVIYSLGFENVDMEDMFKRKADYWAELQAREDLLADKTPKGTPYELHITVAEAPDVDAFKMACRDAEVKPILLDLQTRSNDIIRDAQTSSVVFGKNTDALAALEAQAKVLEAHGLTVVRKKIETVPWHPAAPSRNHAAPVMPKDCYFECHFGVKTQEGAPMERLRVLSRELGCHMSRNVFKRSSEHVIVMLTYRDYEGPYENVTETVDNIAASLRLSGYQVDKEIVEFSLYDTKVHHDAAWLKAA